jgi:hypothetical protein
VAAFFGALAAGDEVAIFRAIGKRGVLVARTVSEAGGVSACTVADGAVLSAAAAYSESIRCSRNNDIVAMMQSAPARNAIRRVMRGLYTARITRAIKSYPHKS